MKDATKQKTTLLHKGVAVALLSTVAAPAMAELEVTPYGSIRTQVESVSVDEAPAGEDDSFVGFRDAFSRFGVKANYALSDSTNLGATLEVPYNTANMQAEDPTYFDINTPRVAKVTASGDFGSAWVGKGWLPYYNHVAWPVDLFSSFYSGWATYAYFREYAASYTTPSFGGFSATLAAIQRYDSYEEGKQFALSYSNGGLTVSYAKEDMDDSALIDTQGVAVSYATGPFYVAVKGEEQIVDGGDNRTIQNFYASYDSGQFTYRGMVASGTDKVDNPDAFLFAPGQSAQVGVDYRYTDSLKVFAEYFMEENAYAILKTDAQSYSTQGVGDSAGQVFLVGARYDF